MVEKLSERCIRSSRTSGMLFLVFLHAQYDSRIDLMPLVVGFNSISDWDPTSVSHPTYGVLGHLG